MLLIHLSLLQNEPVAAFKNNCQSKWYVSINQSVIHFTTLKVNNINQKYKLLTKSVYKQI